MRYTGLYYYRARYYHPGLSRFVSEDPIEFGGGDINLYAYVMANPCAIAIHMGWRLMTGQASRQRLHRERDSRALGTAIQQTTTIERQTGTNFVTAVVDPLGRRTEYVYDSFGNVAHPTRSPRRSRTSPRSTRWRA